MKHTHIGEPSRLQSLDWLKRFSFALSAFGVDPRTVRLGPNPIHDEIVWECNAGDERLVRLALQLCEPEHRLDWQWITFGVRYGSTVVELRAALAKEEKS